MPDDGRTRRWDKPRIEKSLDPMHALRTCIQQLHRVPTDLECRRQLRAIAGEHGLWKELAIVLGGEARTASHRPELALAFYEELVDVHEHLDQELEMIAAMESVIALAPTNADHHDRIAWLYRRAGAWAKAAEAFAQVGEHSRDNRARAALRAAAQLYREHRKLDRAAELYRAIVERKPSDDEAWRALDEVLSELGRWREVAGVRAERASRVDGVEKATLLRSQARALEQAGDLDAAAALVARAAQHAPENVSGLVDHVEVLVRAGQHRDAAALLRQRLDEARVADRAPTMLDAVDDRAERLETEPFEMADHGLATPDPDAAALVAGDDLAALRLRLAKIVDAFDPAEAARILDELLADAPSHAGALELLVAQAARGTDARAHATALRRQAEALPDAAARCAVLVEAARRFRDAGDTRSAIRAYEDATELAIDDDALRDELEGARLALVVERATADAAAGDLAGAERRLRVTLASQPHSLDANLALAELLASHGQLEAAAAHLQSALSSMPDDVDGAKLAPLVHRYATVTAALGDADQAHQLLHEAHRLDRDAVLVTLALGESCFARRLWRQAALHLGALADHPEAARHARAVAVGLVHAGQAEVRGLRPANAPKHYRAAVQLDPACAAAWHALGELAMESGDALEAARCLEHEAIATTEPRARLRLFDALGDLARDVLHDPERAERCWSQVSDQNARDVLEKLLVVQRERDATSELADTCERLANVVEDPARARALLVESARAYALGGQLARAREVADRLLTAHPLDAGAVGCASALALSARDYVDARAMLRRALTAWEQAGDRGNRDATRADLWRRLGDAERELGDPASALAAYRKAVALAPESEGALAARRGLVELAATAGRVEHSSLFALVEAEQVPADVLASARTFATARQHDDARSAFELARALGATLGEADERYLAEHPPRAMAADEGYTHALDDDERRLLVDDPADAPLGDLFELLAEVAPLILPDARSALLDAGFADAQRLAATSDSPASAMYPQIAKAFGGPPTLLYASASAHTALTLLLASPAVVVIGPALARREPTALRFELGRLVELARPRRLFAVADDLRLRVAALWVAAGQPLEHVTAEIATRAEQLRGKLPVAVRQKLAERVGSLVFERLDPDAYRAGCERAADRVGLLACGSVGVALAEAGGPARAPHLVRLAASQRYRALRRRLFARG